jgi:hypothetical protein
MKLESVPQDVAINGDFETTDFEIGDISFIVDMFADKVYSHKERAVIRELSCNAYDSHVEAGNPEPFDVHLPTSLEPWFSVRDYGTGLSDREIRKNYAGIGISTKRDSNKTIGCFGIGSLSPYSLADSFTVKSWLNGVVRTYSCYRDEDRKPVVALLTESATDECNGLEVSLSIEGRVYEFEREAVEVFQWWEHTPNINNQNTIRKCEERRSQYIFEGEDFGLTAGYGDMFAVMGNIGYRISDDLGSFNCDGYLKFELGELNFDTARENLSMDDKTKAAIKAKTIEVKDKLGEVAAEQIEQMPTAFKKAQLAGSLGSGQIGKYIKMNLDKFRLPEPSKPVTYWQSRYNGSEKYTTKYIPVGKDTEYYLHKDRMTTRIKSYLKDMNSGYTMVILTPSEVSECKIDADVLQDLDDLPKITRQGYGSSYSTVKTFTFSRHENRYWGRKPREYWNEVELEINDTDEIVYVEIRRWEPENCNAIISDTNGNISSTLETLKECGVDVPKVHGLKTAFLKTKAFRSGSFIHLDDYVKREYGKIVPKTYYTYDNHQFHTMETLLKSIEFDEGNEFQTLIDDNKNDKIAGVCKRIGITADMQEDTFLQEWMDDFFDKHGMLTLLSDWEIKANKNIVATYIGGTTR